MERQEEASKEPGKSKFVTAGGRAVAVDWRRLKDAQAFFESCETEAHSLPPLCRDSAVGADALQLPGEPPGSSIDDQCMSSGAPVIIGQAESEPLGKFMTAGGRAVSVDTAYLRKIQALFDSCETESSKVSCGRDDSVGTAPPTSFVDNDVSDADDPNAQHDTSAMLCPAGGEPVGKFMTAGGRAVSVDAGRISKVQHLFQSSEAEAINLLSNVQDDQVAVQQPVLQLPRAEDQGCQTPHCNDLLQILNPPSLTHSESSLHIGPASNDSTTHGQHNQNDVFASCEAVDKFMTSEGRADSATGQLHESLALFELREPRASRLRSRSRDHSASRARWQRHQPSPSRDHPGHTGDVSAADDPNAQHDTSAMLCRARCEEPVGKFMTAGGRAVSVDAGRISKVQHLFQSSEAEAINLLSNVQDDQVAVQQPVLQLPRAEDQGCQTPHCNDLLQILNPPSLTHSESSLHIGPASNDSTTHGQHNQNDVFASCEAVDKFMTSEGRADSATGQLHESLALFELREPRASRLRSRSRDHSASRAPWQRHQPSPDSRDHPGHTGDASAADDPNAQHDTSAVLCPAGGEPVGKFMTAGGRAVSVDAGRISKVQHLFQSSEAEAINLLSNVQDDQVAVLQPVLQLPLVGMIQPLPQAASEGSEQAVGGKTTASQALCSQNPRVDRENAHSGKLEPASTASILGEAEAEAQEPALSPICRALRVRPQDAVHFSEDGFDGLSGLGSGKRLLANDLLASHGEDLEEHVPVTDISLIDWVAGPAPPSIVQGFAEECCAESIRISSRYEDRWLRNHLAQLALLSLRSMDAVSRDLKSICKRLGKRARAEIAGRRSAIFQICTGLAPADQHMVLMCTAPWSATSWLLPVRRLAILLM